MIIGLSGPKGSGKDTVAAFLVKEYGYERRAFADPLKKSMAALFDIPFSEVDKMKNNEFAVVILEEGFNQTQWTMREFMQRYGTEAHRDVPEIGDDFWVNLTLPYSGYYANRDMVITDCRFNNEARRIRAIEGVVVYVERAGLVNQDQHSSEQIDFDPDYTIFNNGSIEDLGEGVKIMLEHFNSQL